MRSGDPGWEISKDGCNGSWNAQRDPGQAWPKRGWGTDFASFRFAVPELMNFRGRAVYMDADMLVLGDVAEFLDMPLERGYRCISMKRTDVSLIDCAWFKDRKEWPSIARMKPCGAGVGDYCGLLHKIKGLAPTLDLRWNTCDSMEVTADPGLQDAKLLHYTTVPTQPYHPYPTMTYMPHPWKSWCDAWENELAQANAVPA